MAYKLNLTFGYEGTDFTRTNEFEVADSIQPADIVTGIKAINASLSAGTSDGLDTFFVSDDYDAAQSIGAFNAIIGAKTSSISSSVIYGGN